MLADLMPPGCESEDQAHRLLGRIIENVKTECAGPGLGFDADEELSSVLRSIREPEAGPFTTEVVSGFVLHQHYEKANLQRAVIKAVNDLRASGDQFPTARDRLGTIQICLQWAIGLRGLREDQDAAG